MAMTKQLWSISGLATELGRDRRTIAKALIGVAPDGELSGEKAWFFETALSALNEGKRVPPTPEIDDFTAMLLRRIESRRKSFSQRNLYSFSVDEIAEMSDVRPADVLCWLKAGMPYAEEGNWRTGAGFRIPLIWAMDWQVLICGYAAHRGQECLAKKLGLAQ